MGNIRFADIRWTVANLIEVIQKLQVSKLECLQIQAGCELKHSPLPKNRHVSCQLNALSWWKAPVDIMVMNILLDWFPSVSVELDSCRILPRNEGKIIINRPPTQMVIYCYNKYFNCEPYDNNHNECLFI